MNDPKLFRITDEDKVHYSDLIEQVEINNKDSIIELLGIKIQDMLHDGNLNSLETKLINEMTRLVEILEKRGVGNNISVLVTQEAMSGISSHQLLTDPLIQVEINENNDPEKAFEVMEVLPEIGTLLTSTASDKNGSFLFLVLCKNKNSIQELEKLNITFKEYLQK